MDWLIPLIFVGIFYLVWKDHDNPKTPSGPFPGGRGGSDGDDEEEEE